MLDPHLAVLLPYDAALELQVGPFIASPFNVVKIVIKQIRCCVGLYFETSDNTSEFSYLLTEWEPFGIPTLPQWECACCADCGDCCC